MIVDFDGPAQVLAGKAAVIDFAIENGGQGIVADPPATWPGTPLPPAPRRAHIARRLRS